MALVSIPSTGYSTPSGLVANWTITLNAGDLWMWWGVFNGSLGINSGMFGPPSDTFGTIYNSSNSGSFIIPPKFASTYDTFFMWGVPSGAITTVSININPGNNIGSNAAYWFLEGWTGLGMVVGAVDQVLGAASASQAGPITPLYSNEFIYASCSNPPLTTPTDPSVTFTPGIQNNGTAQTYSAGALLASPATINPSWGTGGGPFFVYVVTFYTAVVAPAVGNPVGVRIARVRFGRGQKWKRDPGSSVLTPDRALIKPRCQVDIGGKPILP